MFRATDGEKRITIEGVLSAAGIFGTVQQPSGKASIVGKCEPDVDSVAGALGVFPGQLPLEEAYPEKQIGLPEAGKHTAKDPSGFDCSFRGTKAWEVGGLALRAAIAGNCAARSLPSTLAGEGDFSAAGGPVACDVGPPVSNPPSPPSVAGSLVNVVSRSLQQWPHITQSEPSVAVRRAGSADQGVVMVGFNDTTALWLVGPNQGQAGVGFAWSADRTRSFQQNPGQLALTLAPRPGPTVRSVSWSDPAFVHDDRGRRFLASAMDLTLYVVPWGIAVANGLMLVREVAASPYEFNGIGVRTPAGLRVDKPWFAPWTVNPPDNSRGFLCYLAIGGEPPRYQIQLADVPTWWSESSGEIVPFRSVPVSDPLQEPNVVQGCQVAQGPDGLVWVSWWQQVSGISTIRIRSFDPSSGILGPIKNVSDPFEAPSDPSATAACGRTALNGFVRYLPFPSMALDPVDGRIYIAYARKDTSPPYLSRIYVARSTDRGDTWVHWKVDDDGPGDRFMPAIAVSATRVPRVMWYDRRNDPENLNVDVYYDTGPGWSTDQRLTSASFGVPRLLPNFDCSDLSQPFRVNDCYMGDYNSVSPGPLDSSSAWEFVHAWGDNSLKFWDPDTQQDVPDPDVRAINTSGCHVAPHPSPTMNLMFWLPVLFGLRRCERVRRVAASASEDAK